MLPTLSTGAHDPPPLSELSLDATYGGYQVLELVESTAVLAPEGEILLGRSLLAVLNLADLGGQPPAQLRELRAGQASVPAYVSQANAQGRAGLIG